MGVRFGRGGEGVWYPDGFSFFWDGLVGWGVYISRFGSCVRELVRDGLMGFVLTELSISFLLRVLEQSVFYLLVSRECWSRLDIPLHCSPFQRFILRTKVPHLGIMAQQ